MTTFTYFEPLIDGHCAFFAQLVLSGAVRDERITRVRLVADQSLINRIVPLAPSVEITALSQASISAMRAPVLLARARAQWSEACKLGVESGGVVFLPFFDHAVVAAAFARGRGAGNARISGIIFRPPNLFGLPKSLKSQVDTARRWATYLLANGPSVGPLFTFDETAPKSLLGRLSGVLHFLPDAAPDLSILSACRPVTRMDGRAVALLFGSLTARKGIFETIEAWLQQSDDWLGRRTLRLVGQVGDEERPRLMAILADIRATKPHVRIELVDQFVDDSTLAAEIVSSDLILAPYQNHIGSSGVIFWSCAAAKPLLTQNTGLIAFQTEKYKLGRTIDCRNSTSLMDALRDPWEAAETNFSFLAQHSQESVQRILLDGVFNYDKI